MRFRHPYACLRRYYTTFNPTPGPATAAPRLPPPPPASGVSNLVPTRRLLEIHGVDAAKYLQAVTTTNIPLLAERSQRGGVYSAFLNPTGRVLHDVFIYPINHSPHWRKTSFAPLDPCFFIEYDVVSEERLLEHIERYKLRSKFTARPLNPGDWNIWYTWDDTTTTPTALEETETIFASDTRCPNFGTRLILPSATPRPNPQHPQVFPGTYKVRRILHGIPEGRSEMAEFPLESNMDYMGGIDFRKGCYVGQELTIRTHHTGVVRKRIYPVQLYRSDPELPMPLETERGLVYDPQDTTIPIHPALKEPKGQGEGEGEERAQIHRANRKGRRAGQVLAAVGNVGLAVCRIEVMTDLVLEAGTGLERTRTPWDEFVVRWHIGMSSKARSFNVKAFVPEWHPRKVPDDGSERKEKDG